MSVWLLEIFNFYEMFEYSCYCVLYFSTWTNYGCCPPCFPSCLSFWNLNLSQILGSGCLFQAWQGGLFQCWWQWQKYIPPAGSERTVSNYKGRNRYLSHLYFIFKDSSPRILKWKNKSLRGQRLGVTKLAQILIFGENCL